MQINLQKYYKPELDNKILIELSKKSDLKGLAHVGLYFTLLFLTGYMAYFTWGTAWTVIWFLIYGNIYNFVNAI